MGSQLNLGVRPGTQFLVPTMSEPNASDCLGVRPLGEAVKIVSEASVKGAAAFLGRICLPAAEEFGLLLRDHVSHWRAQNAARIAQAAERLVADQAIMSQARAHPRIVAQIVDRGSWDDDAFVQQLWAGLLASSCTADDPDDSNLIFVDLLSRITRSEAAMLRAVCERSKKAIDGAGIIWGDYAWFSDAEIKKLSGVTERSRIEREFSHLHSLELTKGGYTMEAGKVVIMPSNLGLHMYARCMGHIGDAATFYGLSREGAA